MSTPDRQRHDTLHAYVDGELDNDARRRTLLQIETDPEVRERVCELQRTKDWVRYSFAGEKAPDRELPRGAGSRWKPAWRAVASIIVLTGIFAAGWQTQRLAQDSQSEMLQAMAENHQRLILQIGVADESRMASVLAGTEEILRDYSRRGVRVEVVANGGGLDMVRTASSRHIDTIRRMIDRYPNVRFIACAKGLERLQLQGQDVQLIQGVSAKEPAADHLIRRLTEGWTLIQI